MNTIEPVLLKELNETDYESLISYRIRKILMICSNYDAFILEEDGQIEAQIFREYIDLNLSNPPKFIWVQTAAEARELLNTVVGIHELHYMDGVPDSLLDYEFKDYFTISIRYVDNTGKYHYEDYSDYLILAAESSYYLVEVGMYSEIEDILDVGHISAQDKVFVYEINEADYGALNNLFNKP